MASPTIALDSPVATAGGPQEPVHPSDGAIGHLAHFVEIGVQAPVLDVIDPS